MIKESHREVDWYLIPFELGSTGPVCIAHDLSTCDQRCHHMPMDALEKFALSICEIVFISKNEMPPWVSHPLFTGLIAFALLCLQTINEKSNKSQH